MSFEMIDLVAPVSMSVLKLNLSPSFVLMLTHSLGVSLQLEFIIASRYVLPLLFVEDILKVAAWNSSSDSSDVDSSFLASALLTLASRFSVPLGWPFFFAKHTASACPFFEQWVHMEL